ncbi:uncharacterized protein LOC110116208 isoform X1 [Dendrobium catenatum]|uniref:Uncharacterized protein n=1 Tax=Dendrobium catenatum TaxID=906689 RepID=A0A2I0WY79_9ASPA|nr:uncharacterized protein LOC110116208 isoform X1 [Dendrobium catenatum]XP_020705364.1 uncharacterized protein LOC110116208 isoform X1 [Dendrobium catenatum]XP_028550400.1 uncharacterized protein LOC110116208 isoform X1 [Dendrobium catenatum]PKU80613.1 hypothetical protein MA16_Dca025266 [Dendrobium catenatum]
MALRTHSLSPHSLNFSASLVKIPTFQTLTVNRIHLRCRRLSSFRRRLYLPAITAALPHLDLNEDNVKQVLIDAKSEFAQIFDASVGITGEVHLAELDGPFVKLRLQGRFWHKRETVLARLANYLKNRIPEVLEVDIGDDKQLDDSSENF